MNISTIIFILGFSFSANAQSNSSGKLVELLDQTFHSSHTEERTEDLISKGKWDADNTIYVIAAKKDNNTLVYAFIKKQISGFTSIKLWEIEPGKIHGKLGRPLDYYDRYEILPNLWSKSHKHKLGVSIVTRTWKNGQRYTTESKPVFIRNDGSLDRSHF